MKPKQLTAKEMKEGNWYSTPNTGRFIAGKHHRDRQGNWWVVIYLDGDYDTQSTEMLRLDIEVYEAIPKC
jgi:hypothetical protein